MPVMTLLTNQSLLMPYSTESSVQLTESSSKENHYEKTNNIALVLFTGRFNTKIRAVSSGRNGGQLDPDYTVFEQKGFQHFKVVAMYYFVSAVGFLVCLRSVVKAIGVFQNIKRHIHVMIDNFIFSYPV
jgi:hypothetical protein